MSTPEHHGLPSASRAASVASAVGAGLEAGVEISTEAFRRSQRRSLAIRGLVFAVGFAAAFLYGLGWVVVALGAVVHYFVFRTRQAVVATHHELIAVTSRRSSATVDGRWPGTIGAELVLRPGEPDVELHLGTLVARLSGIDLAAAETTIRAAGGEPLRVVERG